MMSAVGLTVQEHASEGSASDGAISDDGDLECAESEAATDDEEHEGDGDVRMGH